MIVRLLVALGLAAAALVAAAAAAAAHVSVQPGEAARGFAQPLRSRASSVSENAPSSIAVSMRPLPISSSIEGTDGRPASPVAA